MRTGLIVQIGIMPSRQLCEGTRPTGTAGFKGWKNITHLFAQQVLQSDPDDSPANFAMGMNYFVQEQYGRAEVYLKRCLVRRPNEPAVLNNLAVAQMRQGRLDEAETNATRALKSLPTSTDILRTLKSIQDRKRKQTEAARQKLP